MPMRACLHRRLAQATRLGLEVGGGNCSADNGGSFGRRPCCAWVILKGRLQRGVWIVEDIPFVAGIVRPAAGPDLFIAVF